MTDELIEGETFEFVEEAAAPAYRRIVRSARFTAEEWERVCTRAEQVGLSPGRFLRQAALGAGLGGRVTDRTIALLSMIGSNLNQLARAANAAGELVAKKELENVLLSVRAQIWKLEKGE